MKLHRLWLALALGAGCGLVNSNTLSTDYAFDPPQEFIETFGDPSSTATVPMVACDPTASTDAVRGAGAAVDVGRGQAVVRPTSRMCAALVDVRLAYPVDLSMQNLPAAVVQYGVDKVSIEKIAYWVEETTSTSRSRPSTSTSRRRRPRTRATRAPSSSAPSSKLPAMATACTDAADPDGDPMRQAQMSPVCDVKLIGRRPVGAGDVRQGLQDAVPVHRARQGGRARRRPAADRDAVASSCGRRVKFSVLQVACVHSVARARCTTWSSPAPGPAGVSTAVALVRRDPSLARRIVVLDRAKFPREKPCGGGLTGHADEAMAALGLELTVPSVPSPRAEVRFWDFRREVTLGQAGARDPPRRVRRQPGGAGARTSASRCARARRSPASPSTETASTSAWGRASGCARACSSAPTAWARACASTSTRESDGTPIRLFRLEMPARGAWRSDAMLYDFSPMTDGLRGYLWVFPVAGDRLNVGLMHDPGVARSGGELDALLQRHLGAARHHAAARRRAAGRRSATTRRRRSRAAPHLRR